MSRRKINFISVFALPESSQWLGEMTGSPLPLPFLLPRGNSVESCRICTVESEKKTMFKFDNVFRNKYIQLTNSKFD